MVFHLTSDEPMLSNCTKLYRFNLTLSYLRGWQGVTLYQFGPMCILEFNHKVTGNGYEAMNGCEAVDGSKVEIGVKAEN